MKRAPKLPLALIPIAVLLTGCSAGTSTASTGTTVTGTTSTTIPNLQPYTTPTGTVSTYTTLGSIDTGTAFFNPLGSNGRSCATCHQLAQGMSLNTTAIQALFTTSNGTDPLFAAIDGANCPTNTAATQAAHSLLLNNGLIRIPVTLPATTQFTVAVLSDPYGCAISLSPTTGTQIVSVYRRPLPTASLPNLSSVMWDTRETTSALTTAATFQASLQTDLTAQATDAISTHLQATAAPTATTLSDLLAFEQTLYTAQATDTAAGSLSVSGATGGATALAAQAYYPGINDAFGADTTGARFNPQAFTLYQAWANSTNPAQASISRGENIFNTAPLTIESVRGINDNPALNNPTAIQGSCSTCHDAPNLGHHSLPLPMDTAIARQSATETDPGILAGLAQLSAPSLPVYQITGCKDANNNPITYTTTDPGKALITGLCADVNRMKLPILRGLSARAPYFHNGSAASLTQLVAFYNARFNMRLSPQQQTDLVNFLNAL
jgi:cytochrome c peroxidase